MAHEVTLDIKLRPHQLQIYNDPARFQVRVVHRRFGKTFLSVVELLVEALQTTKRDWRGYYIAPTYTMAKAIAFDYLKSFVAAVPGCAVNESELRLDFHNGARIQLLGAEKYDSLRGRYADKIVLDETAMVPSVAWTTVLSPMLSDRKGSCVFTGTPMGMHNLFYDVWDYAGGDDDEWSRVLLTHEDTGVIDPKEVKRLQRTLNEAEFAQEMMCSWNAALRGAYFSKDMAEAEAAGRVTTVAHDKMLPVNVALDLGWSDAMVAIFHQQAGTEHRIIDCRTYEQTSIPDMILDWRQLPWPIDTVILPHDAKVTELGTGKTRQQVFHEMGCNTTICPNQKIHEGISAVRDLLPHCWFAKDATKTLREALNSYRSEFDEVRGVHKMTPLHDWSSHYADAMRYLAIGRPNTNAISGPRPRFAGVV